MTNLAILLPVILPILFLVFFLSVLLSIVRRLNRLSDSGRKQANTSRAGSLQRTNLMTLDSDVNGNASRMVQKLATMKPEQLYGFFQERLPEKYLGEVSRILTDRNWRREILLFVNRENLWQPLLRTTPSNKDSIQAYENHSDEGDDEPFFAEADTDSVEGLAEDFKLLSDDKKELKTAKRMEKSSAQIRKKHTAGQKALVKAFIAKEILERPDFDRK